MRFSTVGHWAVALVILSGIGNMLLIVGTVPLNWSFEYQLQLTVKIVLVFAMTMLAIVNRYVFVPRLAREPIYEAALHRGTIAEIGLGLLVVGLVAWFGMLQPV
jgi:putative copper resistance protein D